MNNHHPLYQYNQDNFSFVSQTALNLRMLYFPLCGISSEKIKSSITPYLSGDIKLDKDHYLTKPVSTEDLRQNLRNVFFRVGDEVIALADDISNNKSFVQMGALWHKLVKNFPDVGLEIEVLNFVPVSGEDVELMRVKVKNISSDSNVFETTLAVPLFCRALSNKHDHEHVTSLLHRIKQIPEGVMIQPTMAFDERGHQPNEMVYFVTGQDDQNKGPRGSFPTIESFCGDRGTLENPQAVIESFVPEQLLDLDLNGKEAMGGLNFEKRKLDPNGECEYFFVIGAAQGSDEAQKVMEQFTTAQDFDEAFIENEKWWNQKSETILFKTKDSSFDKWMQWVSLQPVLRRIYGCSFLPDHDYGKGGKGWRDIWQDLLSLILIEPDQVRDVLLSNFAGVRIDGSNATIIGSKPGEFLADRNTIARVWMDHGAWPFMTVLLYVHQTGDFDFLMESMTYFKDQQMSRTLQKDLDWSLADGNKLMDTKGSVYEGSILEHILIQHLVPFFNVGEHNNILLECADWNDGLDMAEEKGESVTFSALYGGNLIDLAKLLTDFKESKVIDEINLAKETLILLDSLTDCSLDYDKADQKNAHLKEKYFSSVEPVISGEKVLVKIDDLVRDLTKKGNWIFEHIRSNAKVSDSEGLTWFNGYYDNKGKFVEGLRGKNVRMTLTGQVFPIMSGLANDLEIKNSVDSVNKYLKDERLGGYRLNTDFGVNHYLDLGRAFGFAYGTKENGAFFSHMTVMYANGLYQRGFVREGYEVLRSIYNMAIDTDKSKIYPGIPEYFDVQGRGMYHYLTGSASWLVLTQLTQVFGVRGQSGNLLCSPKLVKEEFDDQGQASVSCSFADKKINVTYLNPSQKDYADYSIKEVKLDGECLDLLSLKSKEVLIAKEKLQNSTVDIEVFLDSTCDG